MYRPDFSNYVAHFSKSHPPCSGENTSLPPLAFDRLIKILSEKKILASRMPWTNKAAVCFTECPFYSMISHKTQYSAYGIGFKKETVFFKGGGPAFYVTEDIYNAQVSNFHQNKNKKIKGFHKDFHVFITLFRPSYLDPNDPIDFSHEREWRTPCDFSFDIKDIEFITVQSIIDVDRIQKVLPEFDTKKILIFDVIEKIEEMWPTHIIK